MTLQSATTGTAEHNAVVAPPCAIVISGAAGDLTKRLVVPALYNLANDRQLSDKFRLVGVDLAAMSAAQWRAHLTEAMKGFVAHDGEFHLDDFDQTTWQWLTDRRCRCRWRRGKHEPGAVPGAV